MLVLKEDKSNKFSGDTDDFQVDQDRLCGGLDYNDCHR